MPALVTAIAASALLAACGGDDATTAPVTPPAAAPLANQLYTQTNESANAIVHFTRQSNGMLVRAESTPTGGTGTNAVGASGATAPDSLASQHSVILSADAKMLFTVNGGDDSISALSIDQTTGALTLLKKSAATAGHMPNSLAYNNGILYATFLSGAHALAAYKVGVDGSLALMAAYDLNSVAGVAGAAPTQAIVTPDGGSLVVSAGTASGAVLSFPINADGSLGTPVANTGLTAPFAAAFLPQKTNPIYLSTSASQGSLTEFTDAAGLLNSVSTASTTASAPGVAAPCWLVLSPDGTIAFVGNGSGAISTYSISPTSGLSLLNATAVTEPGVKSGVTSVAADSWVSPDGKFLYTAYLGDDKVVAYSIGLNGSLAKLGETVIGTSTGISIQGLAGI
ncbi:beta-propeller fold lactonase family protein [Paucibacter sp. R3-3]|uniref:Beta-propeller fold lactonase family protein n=1 Tax=Roseateles agri TaxID=3098619 RepID=A0ABU5DN14_9BURK|nr:beta-propeller fold lactonase family protein [Paucibacter sp. R3-3]MDY0747701.1 beta-propeller fold lactonase family protein [Paucibacter sp. R3-3]